MHGLHTLIQHFKTYGLKHKQLYAASLMLFFFAIFDGIISFITPLVITQKGISESMMGLIIGTSSIAGILFDLILCRVLKDTRFRLIYFLMFIVCSVYPLILWGANTALLFIIAMVMWGLYYDLLGLASLDFIARSSAKEEYPSSFGVLRVFEDLGYLLAPLISGFLIYEIIDFRPFLAAWIFLSLAFIAFILVLALTRKTNNGYPKDNGSRPSSIFTEIYLWKKIGNFILPVLLVSLLINIVDAFFWTIGPLISENLSFLGDLGGLFMTVYILPPLFVGWFVGGVTAKLGKKKTAFYSLLLGSLILSTFFLFKSPVILLVIAFLFSFCSALALPAISAAYADYVSETPNVEKEINTLQDSFSNLGYVIGPIIAGVLSQNFGHNLTFTFLGIFGVLLSLILLLITPKHINIRIKKPKF